VKPQNVLLNGHGEAKVTDFGIARELDVRRGMTETGMVLGTSDYISPEQAQGLRAQEQTDVYSLGVVLYELLTGEVPFTGDSRDEAHHRARAERARAPAGRASAPRCGDRPCAGQGSERALAVDGGVLP
jgi:serine/threonine protein kinase